MEWWRKRLYLLFVVFLWENASGIGVWDGRPAQYWRSFEMKAPGDQPFLSVGQQDSSVSANEVQSLEGGATNTGSSSDLNARLVSLSLNIQDVAASSDVQSAASGPVTTLPSSPGSGDAQVFRGQPVSRQNAPSPLPQGPYMAQSTRSSSYPTSVSLSPSNPVPLKPQSNPNLVVPGPQAQQFSRPLSLSQSLVSEPLASQQGASDSMSTPTRYASVGVQTYSPQSLSNQYAPSFQSQVLRPVAGDALASQQSSYGVQSSLYASQGQSTPSASQPSQNAPVVLAQTNKPQASWDLANRYTPISNRQGGSYGVQSSGSSSWYTSGGQAVPSRTQLVSPSLTSSESDLVSLTPSSGDSPMYDGLSSWSASQGQSLESSSQPDAPYQVPALQSQPSYFPVHPSQALASLSTSAQTQTRADPSGHATWYKVDLSQFQARQSPSQSVENQYNQMALREYPSVSQSQSAPSSTVTSTQSGVQTSSRFAASPPASASQSQSTPGTWAFASQSQSAPSSAVTSTQSGVQSPALQTSSRFAASPPASVPQSTPGTWAFASQSQSAPSSTVTSTQSGVQTSSRFAASPQASVSQSTPDTWAFASQSQSTPSSAVTLTQSGVQSPALQTSSRLAASPQASASQSQSTPGTWAFASQSQSAPSSAVTLTQSGVQSPALQTSSRLAASPPASVPQSQSTPGTWAFASQSQSAPSSTVTLTQSGVQTSSRFPASPAASVSQSTPDTWAFASQSQSAPSSAVTWTQSGVQSPALQTSSRLAASPQASVSQSTPGTWAFASQSQSAPSSTVTLTQSSVPSPAFQTSSRFAASPPASASRSQSTPDTWAFASQSQSAPSSTVTLTQSGVQSPASQTSGSPSTPASQLSQRDQTSVAWRILSLGQTSPAIQSSQAIGSSGQQDSAVVPSLNQPTFQQVPSSTPGTWAFVSQSQSAPSSTVTLTQSGVPSPAFQTFSSFAASSPASASQSQSTPDTWAFGSQSQSAPSSAVTSTQSGVQTSSRFAASPPASAPQSQSTPDTWAFGSQSQSAPSSAVTLTQSAVPSPAFQTSSRFAPSTSASVSQRDQTSTVSLSLGPTSAGGTASVVASQQSTGTALVPQDLGSYAILQAPSSLQTPGNYPPVFQNGAPLGGRFDLFSSVSNVPASSAQDATGTFGLPVQTFQIQSGQALGSSGQQDSVVSSLNQPTFQQGLSSDYTAAGSQSSSSASESSSSSSRRYSFTQNLRPASWGSPDSIVSVKH